jgi:hypothetical protein
LKILGTIKHHSNSELSSIGRRLSDPSVKKSDVFNDLLKESIARSPENPITGANGLLQTSAASDFDMSIDPSPDGAGSAGSGWSVGELAGHQFGGAFEIASSRINGRDAKSITLPLSYTIRNDIDPRRQLILSVPLTMVKIGGVESWSGSFGVAYRLPVTRAWTLTPAIRYGHVRSHDLASLSSDLVSASISSNYVFRLGGFDLAVGNMVGHYQTTRVKIAGYSVDPNIRNTVLRNGILFSQPVSIAGRSMFAEYSLIDTRYLGSDIHTDNTQEIGFSLGKRGITSARSSLRAGFKYRQGRDVKSVMLNVGYWF